jgi:hypothetical protein
MAIKAIPSRRVLVRFRFVYIVLIIPQHPKGNVSKKWLLEAFKEPVVCGSLVQIRVTI